MRSKNAVRNLYLLESQINRGRALQVLEDTLHRILSTILLVPLNSIGTNIASLI